MKEKDLEKYLKILSSERCIKKPKEAVVILEKISNCFTHESSQFTLGILSSLLLDENDAIYTFIWKTSAHFETLSCVSAAFKLLDYLVTNFQKCTEPYFSALYQKCVFLLDTKFAKVKELSLKLIKKIMESDSKHTLNLSELVSKLEKYLREEDKISGIVADQIFSLFGYLFEKYPESVKNEKWVLLKMHECLKQECSLAKKLSLGRIKGAFDGINGYLMNYPPPDEEIMKEIYEFIKKCSNFQEDKKVVGRAGLNVLQNHWRHFSSLMYDDRDLWRINLEIWMNQRGADRQMAFKFLCSFYSVIALFTKQKSNSSEVKSYIKDFSKSVASNGNFYEKKAALVGIKLFVLTGSLTTDDFNETYDVLINFIKQEEIFKRFSYIPLCIECISALALKFSKENMEPLSFLQRLSVKLIENYPTFDEELQRNALIALEKSFYIMGLSNLQISDNHIGSILYQGLIRTCSSMTLADFELLIEVGEKPGSSCYKSFLSLWQYLLTLANTPYLPVGGSFPVKKGVAVKVFDAFVGSFLKIVSKLDFSVGSGMELEKPSDLHIFINIVDLYQDLMPLIDSFSLQKWVIEIFKTVVNLSYKNPLLSGFYKIVAANLKIADKTHFFEEKTQENEKCFELVRKYLEDTLAKVDHYKGELQVACLNVLLASPGNIIEGLVEKVVPALEVITQLARNSFPLLKDLIETLERWDLCLASATSGLIMRKVLPLLDVFFQSPYFQGKNSVDSSKGGKKLKVEVVFNDSELLTLQKRFLMFLGNLEISKSLNLIEVPDTEEKRDINDKHLVYFLPFGNRLVELSLDEMIPRVVVLAESCGDRKTRITACELLYSMVVVIVGNISQHGGGYGFLFRKVAKACLLLGCDSDGLVCQIFEPLMYQIVHYLSGKQALNLSEADDLIHILMDGVTCPYNPNVRNFSGELLREFTQWSIKSLSPQELKTTPESTKRILQKIYSLALHPSYNKRLGAAVIFNKIYSVLREEELILNTYWFQLYYHFVESLRMCEGHEDVTEITEAIRHVERPLVEKRQEFNRDFPGRMIPPEFEGGRLCHLVKWTMERACDVQPTMRRTAMSLVQELAPLVENCDSNMSFTSKQLQNFLRLGETPFQSGSDRSNFIEWLKYHFAGFEYCTWLLEENVLTTEEIFQPKFKTVLKRFINGIMSCRESNPTLDRHKQQAVIAFIILLYTLKERAYLYPPEHWDLLKTAVFRPSEFGFDLYQSSSTERLLSVLLDLLRHLSSHLTKYDWDHFYRDLETLVTAPVFGHITRYKSLTVGNLEFLFALRVIEGSGVWNAFMEKIFFSMNSEVFIAPMFRSLFFKRGKTEYAVALEPSCKSYLEEILKILLKSSTGLNGLMKYLENEEEVREEDTEKPIKKGEFFQWAFKTAIFNFVESERNLLIDWAVRQSTLNGVKFLIQVLENQTEDPDLALEIFMRWHEFEQVSSNASEKNKLLFRLALSGGRVVGTPGFLKTSPVADKIYAILENRKLEDVEYSEIETIFGLFPFFSVFGESADENEKLRTCLSKILVDVNAVREVGEPFKGSHARIALNGILQSLKTTGSLVVLDFIARKAPWVEAICKKEDLESSLTVFGEVRTTVGHSLAALEIVYRRCFEQEVTDVPTSVVYKLFMSPLLNLVPHAVVYQFFERNLENLHRLVSSYWGGDGSLSEILARMAAKICVARMFQTFFKRLSKEELDQMPKEKRQMIDATVKNVFFFLKRPYPTRVLKDRHRKLMCEIFNMICCIVSARCTDEKFYKLFIFDDRGSFLFEVIDKKATYDLGMDFEEIPKRKKHLTVLRESIAGNPGSSFGREPVKYIQTNTLFTSSLREEVTRFDLTSSFIRPMNSVPDAARNVEIELEMDSLNSHECMATLVATISKMVRDKITPVDDVTEPPCWLRFFLSVLRKSDFCDNLKLFVLKAIYNVQEFVAPFCKQIFSDLLDAILKLFVNYPINYFLLDLIEMMVDWRHLPENEMSRVQLTELVEIILQKSDSVRRDIVKYNLEVLKVMIEVWKSVMFLPQLSSTVFERLSKSVEEDLRMNSNGDSVTYLNIHTCGILLSNGIPVWRDGSEGLFFELILKGFRDGNKHNQLFGEVCGQALNHLQRTKPKCAEEHEQLVRDKINSLSGSWLQLLYGVHKHHPKMSSLFTFSIFSSAWDSMDSLTVKKLEMLLSHVSASATVDDVTFDRHASAFLMDMLNSPDPDVQEYSLRIADKLLHKLDKEKLKVIMQEVVRLQGSVHPGVRKWVYEIGKKLYGKGPDVVFPECRAVLLRGLNDGTKDLEDACVEFWRGVLNATSPEFALPQMLSDMYSPDTEDIFLSNAVRVLLHLAEDDFRSKKELFPHPIFSRCRFRKRNLVLGVRQSFLASLASSERSLTNQSLENVATIRHRNLPHLTSFVSTLNFQPTAEEEEDSNEIVAPAACPPQQTPVPANPFKRRFYKSEAKTAFSFARRPNKKQEIEKIQPQVEIYGEYRNGDYPDIQIRHSQITKLLQVLSKRDQQLARMFLVSFYSGLIKSVSPAEREIVFSKTSKHFENILKSSGNFDPGLFGFLLHVILNHGRNLEVDHQLVSNAAVSSNWISLGALIIEQIIANGEGDDEEVKTKKRKGCESSEEKKWLELARLYRSLEEFDVVSGIFLDKLSVSEDAKEAIRCESVWDWAEASRNYESVLRSNPDANQIEFYTESYLSCLAKLSNWSLLNNCIRTTVNNDLDELWNNYYLLSWFLKSEMMISLGTDRHEFLKVLQEFCQNAVKRDILAANFGEEMTVFDWFSDNLQRANYRIDKLCLDFLAGWSHLDRWSHNLRAAKLANLQTLSELSFAMKNLAEVSKSQLEENINLGVKRWEKNVPAPRDELTVWDVKLGYRREFLRRLHDFDLSLLDVKANLALAKAALHQENLNLTKECLSRAKEKMPEGNFDLKSEHHVCFNMGKMVVAKLKMKDPNVGLEVYLNVWNRMSRQTSSLMETDSDPSKTLAYSCNFTLGQLVTEILPFVKKRTVSPEILQSLCQKLNSSESDLPIALQDKGLFYFEAAIAALENAASSSEAKSNAYLELSKFLLKFPESGRFEKLSENLLKSMALGNPEARQLFGCLLNVSHLLPDDASLENVVAECSRVPSWMFLAWINQMLASLNSRLSPFLMSLLLRITEDYPNAIRYPLKLTEGGQSQNPKTRAFLMRLSEIVSRDKLYDDFWNAVKFLAPPDLILTHHLQNALEQASLSDPSYVQIRQTLTDLKQLMFSKDFTKFRGPVFKFWETFENPIEDLFTEVENLDLLTAKIKNILSSVQKKKMPSRRTLALLESYSPWLCNFHALKADATLELPGQYDGDREPIKKHLVSVSSFRNSVLTFDSKCRPMRIGVLGNDAKEHRFLVKFGEDPRQDERMQQVFRHFGRRLKECRQTRKFSLDTYKVVPLTSSLGLIEWVDDSVSLYEMMETSLGNDSDAVSKAQGAHLAFLCQESSLAVPESLGGTVAAHLMAYEVIKRERAISNFRATARLFPKDLLKKSFLDLSTNPEHFLHLRGNFATSHAITCVTHWLVGIGDRHLQNILVSTKTGRVLGIDFGYGFGFATQFLSPPELVPFRLSPQILNVMHPLEESGWIKQTMIHCLRLFRKDCFRLRAVLEVFAEEPVMNWLKQVKKNPNYQSGNDTWYPREKLALVERKLNGANPVAAFEADLRAGHSQSRYLEKYLEVLRGCRQFNIRARCVEDGLTEEEQVECLIDLATDHHVLSKTYIGWNPWL